MADAPETARSGNPPKVMRLLAYMDKPKVTEYIDSDELSYIADNFDKLMQLSRIAGNAGTIFDTDWYVKYHAESLETRLENCFRFASKSRRLAYIYEFGWMLTRLSGFFTKVDETFGYALKHEGEIITQKMLKDRDAVLRFWHSQENAHYGRDESFDDWVIRTKPYKEFSVAYITGR